MEKITVQIGRSLGTCKPAVKEIDIRWLMKVLECSWKRADKIVSTLHTQVSTRQGRKPYLILVMNYKQLARYTAMRAVDGLIPYWTYPIVTVLIQDFPSPAPIPIDEPIEVRPGVRTK